MEGHFGDSRFSGWSSESRGSKISSDILRIGIIIISGAGQRRRERRDEGKEIKKHARIPFFGLRKKSREKSLGEPSRRYSSSTILSLVQTGISREVDESTSATNVSW